MALFLLVMIFFKKKGATKKSELQMKLAFRSP
jgi:hypothetical protein